MSPLALLSDVVRRGVTFGWLPLPVSRERYQARRLVNRKPFEFERLEGRMPPCDLLGGCLISDATGEEKPKPPSGGTPTPVPGETVGEGDLVVISPVSPPDRFDQEYGGAEVINPCSLQCMEDYLETLAEEDYDTLYVVGHGILGGPYGTSFPGPDFAGTLPPDLIAAIQGVLDEDGTIIIESCADTNATTLEEFTSQLQNLADQLGYDVWGCYGSGYYDPVAGASCDGTWVHVEPNPPSGGGEGSG